MVTLTLLLLTITASPEQLLQERPDLDAHHNAYLQTLAANPTLAQAERAWWQLHLDPHFRQLDQNFQLALAEDSSLNTAFLDFYRNLPAGGEMENAQALLNRLNTSGDGLPLLGSALQFLQQNPGAAMGMLRGSGVVGESGLDTSQVAGQLQQYLSDNPEAVEELRTVLGALVASPESRERLGASASVVGALQPALGKHQELLQHFVQHPGQFWTWHQRNTALAQAPESAEWIRWWHLRVQAEPGLRDAYVPWLAQQPSPPGTAQAPQDSTWAGTPPALPTLPKAHALPATPKAAQKPAVPKPPKPTIKKPQRPNRPAIPEMRESTRTRER